MLRGLARRLLPLAALPLGAAAPAPGWTASDDDYLLLSVQLGRLTLSENVQGYRTPEGMCLVLADAARAFDFPIAVKPTARTAEGWFVAETNRFRLDRAAATVTVGAKILPLADADLRDTPEGWCADAGALSRWWGLTLTPDLPNALIRAKSEVKLPVELAVERRARQAKLYKPPKPALAGLPRADPPYRLWRTPAIDVVASLDAIDDKTRGRRLDAKYELYASGEVARVSADARLASDRHGVPSTLRLRGYRKDAQGGLLGPLKATMAAAGDVHGYASTLVSQGSVGRGVMATNQPLDRPQDFDRTDFRGELPQGWDAELYRNGQLIAFSNDRADGRYEFRDVSLLYGQNRFEIVLYGPQGQVRREARTLAVGQASIPPKKTFWWAGVLQDNKDLFTLRHVPDFGRGNPVRASAAIERGLDQRTSLALQLHSLEIEDERLTYVEGSVRRSIGPALVEANVAVTTGGGRAGQINLLAEAGDSYIAAESLWAKGFRSDRVQRGVASRHSVDVDHFFKTRGGVIPVSVGLAYTDWRERADELAAAARVSASLAGFSITNELRWLSYARAPGPEPPDRIEGVSLLNTRIGPVRLRGEGRYRLRPDADFESATVVGEWRAGERGDWRAEVAYERPLDRARFGVGYAHRFDRFAVGAFGEAATDGSIAAGLNLVMSLGTDVDGRFGRLSSEKLATFGQAAARVFTDENGDGRFTPGEPTHPNVTLAAGNQSDLATTGADGRAMVDNLRAFQPQLLSLDLTSIDDPYLQPAVPGIVLTPRPGVATPVDLALVRAGEVEGTLLLARGEGPPAPLGGGDLELIDGLGQVARATRSDYDGFFLFEAVPHGRYTLRLAPATAERLKLARPLAMSVEVGGDRPVANLGKLRLEASSELVKRMKDAESESILKAAAFYLDAGTIRLLH